MTSLKTPKAEPAESATERSSAQGAARLQRAVLKLAFSFYGNNPELDERLKRLGNLIKAGRKDGIVQALIDEVVEVIVAREAGQGGVETAAKQIGELIGKTTFEGELADEARAIQRRLMGSKSKDELDRQMTDAAALFSSLARRANAHEDTENEPREGPLFDSFLSELQLPAELTESLEVIRQRIRRQRSQSMMLDCARDVARLLSERLRTPTEPLPVAGTALVDPVALATKQLHALVEQLELPSSLARESIRVKALLDSARCEEDIGAAVSTILVLLNQARSKSQQEVNELATFLKAVNRRLEDFKGHVVKTSAVHEESISSTSVFQRLISSQVADMRERVDEESDITSLKLLMISQLESLEAGIQSFVSTEQTRHTDARSQFDVMLSRLNELESETQKLRSDLDEQHTLSLLDPLTGVFNRMGYNEGMGREHARWKRYGGELSLVIFDLDLFKSINDNYGHAAGDKVLASLASLLRRQIRHCDILCRLGGEEFAIILPETGVVGAANAAEKLRASVATSQFRFKEQPVPVTVSIGIAEFREQDTQEDVFERADRALYLAKKLGRNRCCTEQDLEAQERASANESTSDEAPRQISVG